MAATQKTLTPTNEVISIPAFADKPDYRLPIDSTGKLADAINALDRNLTPEYKTVQLHSSQTQGNISEIKMTKVGNVVSLAGYVSGLSAASGGATVLTFPADCRPKQVKDSSLPVRATCIIDSAYNGSKIGGVAIGGDATTGSVWIYYPDEFSSFAIGVTWIC